jgi:hypothetical protein
LIANGISGLNHKKAIARMQTQTHLPTIDPNSEDYEQELPWLKLRFYIPPDAR